MPLQFLWLFTLISGYEYCVRWARWILMPVHRRYPHLDFDEGIHLQIAFIFSAVSARLINGEKNQKAYSALFKVQPA